MHIYPEASSKIPPLSPISVATLHNPSHGHHHHGHGHCRGNDHGHGHLNNNINLTLCKTMITISVVVVYDRMEPPHPGKALVALSLAKLKFGLIYIIKFGLIKTLNPMG